MDQAEIRLSKIKLLRFIIPMAVALPVITYGVYFTDKFSGNGYLKYWVPILDVFGIYMLFKPVKELIENASVISLSKNYLVTNQGGESKSFKWTDILEVSFTKDEKNGVDLIKIMSKHDSIEVNISLLDKSPEEIEILINKFR